MKEHLLNVLTQENIQENQHSEQVFRAEDSKKLSDIPMTKEMVEQEIDSFMLAPIYTYSFHGQQQVHS